MAEIKRVKDVLIEINTKAISVLELFNDIVKLSDVKVIMRNSPACKALSYRMPDMMDTLVRFDRTIAYDIEHCDNIIDMTDDQKLAYYARILHDKTQIPETEVDSLTEEEEKRMKDLN
jgi:hypothetical protein